MTAQPALSHWHLRFAFSALTSAAIAHLAACGTDVDHDTTTTMASALGEDPCGPEPLAPTCNIPQCGPEGWVFWPLPEGHACHTDLGSGECDGGILGPPSQIEPDQLGECVVSVGHLDPIYHVLTVVYAPPGRNGGGSTSSVTYSAGSTTSTSTETSKTFKEGVSVSATLKIPLVVDIGASYGYSKSKTDTTSLAMTKSATFSITSNGPPADGIDHDEDGIYLWLNPRLHLGDAGGNLLWTFGLNDPTNAGFEIQYVKVGSLKGTLPMPPGVQTALAAHGITAAEYPGILAYDDFASGSTTVDPGQFTAIPFSFPYEPPTSANGTPDSFQLTLTNGQTNTSTTSRTRDHTTKVTVSILPSVADKIAPSVSVSGDMTWTNKTTNTQSAAATESASLTIRGPSFGYAGPTNVQVFFDKLYKTFLFRFITTPAPGLRGRILTRELKPLVHQRISVLVDGIEHQTITNRNGDYQFFDLPSGRAEVWVLPEAKRQITLAKGEIVRVDFTL